MIPAYLIESLQDGRVCMHIFEQKYTLYKMTSHFGVLKLIYYKMGDFYPQITTKWTWKIQFIWESAPPHSIEEIFTRIPILNIPPNVYYSGGGDSSVFFLGVLIVLKFIGNREIDVKKLFGYLVGYSFRTEREHANSHVFSTMKPMGPFRTTFCSWKMIHQLSMMISHCHVFPEKLHN